MFESLSEKLQNAFGRLGRKGRLTEQDVDEALREVRMALLEADVSFKVAKQFIASIRERAVGTDVLQSLTPAQQVIKIVHEELLTLPGVSPSSVSSSATRRASWRSPPRRRRSSCSSACRARARRPRPPSWR